MQHKRKQIIKSASCSLIALLLMAVASISMAAHKAATVQSVVGYATVTTEKNETKRLKVGDELHHGDVVKTGENSTVSFYFANNEVVTLAPLSEYTIGSIEKIAGNGISGGASSGSSSPAAPTLSTATSAGGGVIPGSPIN